MTVTAATTPSIVPPRYRNAAEWLHDLGDVPLERIVFDPWPGTATEADLLRKVETEDRLCELIDGTLVEKPVGAYESLLAMLLVQELLNFIRPRRLGAVIGPDGPLRLRLGLVRLPDISYISSERLKGGKGLKMPIPSLIPDLAVEVLSPGNRPGEMQRKREEYFSSGVRLVWIIDPTTRTAEAYRGVSQSVHVAADATLGGEDVLPGFEVRLDDLFKAADEASEGLL